MARDLDVASDRASRFRMREEGKAEPPVRLEELRAWPRWPRETRAEQARIFAATALRASDAALREVICGDTLRSYAAILGEDLLELMLARPTNGSAPLPSTGALIPAGRAHAEAALPPRLAEKLGVTAAPFGQAARFVAEAEALAARAPLAGGGS